MGEQDHISKRRYARYNVTVFGQIRALNGTEWRRLQVVTLSTNGACATVSGPKFTSELVEIKMGAATPQRAAHHMFAKIVWSVGDRIGLEFVSGQ